MNIDCCRDEGEHLVKCPSVMSSGDVVTFMSCVMRKCASRSLSLSYLKKDWQAGPHQSFFGYDIDYKITLSCFQGLCSVVSVIPKEGLAGPRPPILLVCQ